MDQHRAAAAHPDPAVADVGERRRVAVRTVDVQHVDRAHDRRQRLVAELAHVTHPVAHSGRRRLARNTSWSSAASAANPSISCGPRSLPACGSIATTSTSGAAPRQHDRAAAAEAADLDDRSAGGSARRPVVQRRRLAGTSNRRRRRRRQHRRQVERSPVGSAVGGQVTWHRRQLRRRRASTARGSAALGREAKISSGAAP